MNKLNMIWQILRNMGIRYVLYRLQYELKIKTGLLKKSFPTIQEPITKIAFKNWKTNKPIFLVSSREDLTIRKSKTELLKLVAENVLTGKINFFNNDFVDLGLSYDWLTNPTTKRKYPLIHWTEIPDFSEEYGDIKEVWEKSRFSYLIPLIRYDYSFDKDLSKFALDEIINWIDANPLNLGPNYRCSQEISIRLLNWTYLLYYYQNSPNLTEELFDKILNSMYGQICHVYTNINFSRIAVRNNHAITETLTLYLMGLLFPDFPESKLWKVNGKKWFEKEIGYQIYEDGTFLQFSMTYHRVVIQLLNYAIGISERNNEKFADEVYQRANKSFDFLTSCMSFKNGYLPNYGANDGALFFPFSDTDYRDFRPQLNTLAILLNRKPISSESLIDEDALWHSLMANAQEVYTPKNGIYAYAFGGYYIIREEQSLTFVRCGNHKDRPSHADNLHLDVWINGENVLFDAGSYKYNTTAELIDFFTGTASHNTVIVNNASQMKKGMRFIWFYWTQRNFAKLIETPDKYIFEGEISCYRFMSKSFTHKRQIEKPKNKLYWQVNDEVSNLNPLEIKQNWNICAIEGLVSKVFCSNNSKEEIKSVSKKGWHSSYYGSLESIMQTQFISDSNKIETTLEWIKEN